MRLFFETPALNKGQRSWVITLEILPNRSLAKRQSTQCTHSPSQRTLCPTLLGVAKTPGYHWVSPVPGSSWDFHYCGGWPCRRGIVAQVTTGSPMTWKVQPLLTNPCPWYHSSSSASLEMPSAQLDLDSTHSKYLQICIANSAASMARTKNDACTFGLHSLQKVLLTSTSQSSSSLVPFISSLHY